MTDRRAAWSRKKRSLRNSVGFFLCADAFSTNLRLHDQLQWGRALAGAEMPRNPTRVLRLNQPSSRADRIVALADGVTHPESIATRFATASMTPSSRPDNLRNFGW